MRAVVREAGKQTMVAASYKINWNYRQIFGIRYWGFRSCLIGIVTDKIV